MRHEILYQQSFPIVRCDLTKGESIKAESDAMVTMSANLDVEGSAGDGGIIGGLARKFLTGESFFFQRITASRGSGSVLLAPPEPGGIADIILDGSHGLRVKKNGFLAAEETVEIDTATQNLSKGLFSGAGFFVLNIHGKGVVFLSCFGAIHQLEIAEGEEVIIDNGHIVAWPDFMDYRIEKASHGLFSSMASGEGLVCRFKGPGIVLIQTRNSASFLEWVKNMTR